MVCSPVSFFSMQSGLRLQSVRLQKKLSAGFPCFRSVFAYAIVSREVLLPSRCIRKRVQSVRSARTKGPPPLAPPLWEGNSPIYCRTRRVLPRNVHGTACEVAGGCFFLAFLNVSGWFLVETPLIIVPHKAPLP